MAVKSGLHSGGISRFFFFQPDEINWGQDMRRAQKREEAGNNDKKRQKGFFSDIDLGEEELYKIQKGRKVLPDWLLASRKRCRLSWFNMFSEFQHLLKSAKTLLQSNHAGKNLLHLRWRRATQHGAAITAERTSEHSELPPLLLKQSVLQKCDFWPGNVSKYPHSMQGSHAGTMHGDPIPPGCSTASHQNIQSAFV